MDTVKEIADILRRDGYNIRNVREVEVGLEEDLHYSYEDAVRIAPMVVKIAS
ncbi:MAG: hypothetical protein Q4E47_00240 [Candidatus Saccharibacteria bacterium]|nr:hypothetical protein [Candidatus Saccharibacteria bacterium]